MHSFSLWNFVGPEASLNIINGSKNTRLAPVWNAVQQQALQGMGSKITLLPLRTGQDINYIAKKESTLGKRLFNTQCGTPDSLKNTK
jgi:hypothetical protein